MFEAVVWVTAFFLAILWYVTYIIEKITVLKGPLEYYDVKPEDVISIYVDAVTDPLRQAEMKYEWIRYDEIEDPNNEDKTIIGEYLYKIHIQLLHPPLVHNNYSRPFGFMVWRTARILQCAQ